MKRTIIATAIAGLLGLGAALPSWADPDFGTGNSSKKNNDPGAVCSPSKIKDTDLNQCK